MAKQNQQTVPQAPVATPPATPPAVPPSTPVVPVKAKKEKPQVFFTTAAEAEAAAKTRVKGPRKAFTVTFQGKTWHVVHNNDGRALGAVMAELGGKAEKLGAKAPTALTPDQIRALFLALPAEEQAKITK